VELRFQHIKVSLAMDVLRGKSPELIAREVLLHRIAYHLIRCLLQRSAHLHRVTLERISFKGSLDTLRHWAPVIAAASRTPRKQDQLIDQMLATIARDPVPKRPGRSEPRARKRKERKTTTCLPSQDTKPATENLSQTLLILAPFSSA
jgi:hypothetical protein